MTCEISYSLCKLWNIFVSVLLAYFVLQMINWYLFWGMTLMIETNIDVKIAILKFAILKLRCYYSSQTHVSLLACSCVWERKCLEYKRAAMWERPTCAVAHWVKIWKSGHFENIFYSVFSPLVATKLLKILLEIYYWNAQWL